MRNPFTKKRDEVLMVMADRLMAAEAELARLSEATQEREDLPFPDGQYL